MVPQSVALTTELAIAATRGRVIDRGDYMVVETPDEPGWIDGNYLALPTAPKPGELAHWEQTFAEELSPDYAVSLRWDDDSEAPPELAAAGFEIEALDLMIAGDVLAPPHILPMRALAPAVVATTADLAWAVADRHDEMYRQFLKNRARWQQTLVADDRARFFGCFEGTQLVASCGVFFVGDIARYQDVQTLPTHRRRGIAGALLATAARDAAARGSKRFAILAQPGSDAQRVYRRVGFAAAERSIRASRYPTIARRTK